MEKYQYTSLCIVRGEAEGNTQLDRIADVSGTNILNGLADKWPAISNFPLKNGPSMNNFMGIWNWVIISDTAIHEKNILSSFNFECSPIEVIVLSNCANIEEVIRSLKEGVKGPLLSERVMYACFEKDNKHYAGVLCTDKELASSGNKVCLKKNILYLDRYDFQESDAYRFEDRMVFKMMKVKRPVKSVTVRSSMDVVKDIIVSRATWPTMKQIGLTRYEYKHVRDFLANLPTESLYEEISEIIGCGSGNAENLVKVFLERIDDYINGTNIENVILFNVIQNSPELIEQCKTLLSEEWRAENSSILAEAESNLNKVYCKLASEKENLEKISQDYLDQKEKLDTLNLEITEQEKLASDVENAVKSRIEKAKENAAAFIATQAFAQPTIVSQAEPPGKEPIILKRGYELPAYNIDTYNDWLYLLEFLQSKLEDEGVSDKWSKDVAAFLYAAFLNHCPILLIGPNGRAIADTFSACVSGRTCAYLDCETKYNPKILDELEKTDEAVVVIDNLFNPEWNRHINSYAENSPKFVIAITPYAEDLLIEPKGVLNYWIPLMTELFVERKPDYDFKGGKQGKDFRYFVSTKSIRKSGRSLRKLKLSPLTRTTLQKLLTDMFLMVESDPYNLDAELLVAGIPCAYILGELDCLNEYKDESVVKESMLDILKRYLGEAE